MPRLETACPSGVKYGTLLEETRAHIEHTTGAACSNGFCAVHYRTGFSVSMAASMALLPVRGIRFLRLNFMLPKFAREMMGLCRGPGERGKSVNVWARVGKGGGWFVEGCVMQVMFGDTNESSVGLLNGWLGCYTPKGQGFCGACMRTVANWPKLEIVRDETLQRSRSNRLTRLSSTPRAVGQRLSNTASCLRTILLGQNVQRPSVEG
ncbi:MAG: hypothetical protein Ct9H300mP7_4920 [Verrucomicrobiota bacterium]|nr:MAG: hypothetical protein Ct9H300mP7_4920 [Verrucomicrobiota bacterium]